MLKEYILELLNNFNEIGLFKIIYFYKDGSKKIIQTDSVDNKCFTPSYFDKSDSIEISHKKFTVYSDTKPFEGREFQLGIKMGNELFRRNRKIVSKFISQTTYHKTECNIFNPYYEYLIKYVLDLDK